MADSTTHLNTISASQAAKEATANELFDAHSPASLFGRNADATSALTWGLYGGKYRKADGTITTKANSTVSLTASATNYILETDGTVSKVTAAPLGWPGPLASNAKALYEVVTDSSGVTSYTDYRTSGIGSGATATSGTVTSVAASVPAFLSIAGSPVTTSGTLAITYSGTALPIANGGTGGTSASAARTALGLGTVATLASDTDVTLAANSDTVVATQKATKAYVDAQIAGSGSGDVVGPASAVNNRVVFFDGTTGKLIKDSGLTLSGSNTGDQTSVTGNAGTATALQTARTIGGVSFDGTANITQPYDIPAFYPGVPTASAKLLRFKLARAVTFAANFSGSQFTATANATGSTVFDIQKNGSSVGSCTIASGGTTPTFASSGGAAVSFAAGDVLAIIAPGTADATLADPAITLVGAR